MASKKKTKSPSATKTIENLISLPLKHLEKRVSVLEHDTHSLQTKWDVLAREVHGLRKIVQQVDQRTLRGEQFMMELQVQSVRANKLLERIADAIDLKVTKPVASPNVPPDLMKSVESAESQAESDLEFPPTPPPP